MRSNQKRTSKSFDMGVVLTLLLLPFFLNTTTQAQTPCQVPEDLERPLDSANRATCRQNTTFLISPITSITPEQAALGPRLKDSTFRSDEVVHCRYFYRYQNGASNKFRCYRTDKNQTFFNNKGDLVPLATAVLDSTQGDEGILLGADGKPLLDTQKRTLKADILKVRFQDGSARHRENYSSAAASRFAWIMGIPMEHYYSVAKVVCFGCEKNPWNEGKNPQPAYKEGVTNEFPFASIERKFEAKRVFKAYSPEDDSFRNIPWKWQEFAAQLSNMPKSRRIEFETLALFANFFQVMEHRGSQHVMLCEKEFYDKQSGSCSQTLAAIHDMGGALGNRKLIDPTSNNHPRADYKAYAAVKLFETSTSCAIGYNTPGLAPFLPQSFSEFNSRLKVLTPEIIASILHSIHFAYADLPFRSAVRAYMKKNHPDYSSQDLNDEIIKRWTALIQQKISEQLGKPCI